MAESFTPRTWTNGGGVALNATNLNALEQGIESIDDRVAVLEANTGNISPTVVDAKGDLIAATAADTVTRQPAGADGSVLTATSAAATGMSWTGVAMTSAERAKLSGVADNATLNSPDDWLLDRAHHTGTQPLSSLATTGTVSSATFLRSDAVFADPSLLALAVHAVGNSGTALTVDASSTSGWVKTITLSANCAITLTGTASGRATRLELILTQDATGSRTVTWPTTVKWTGGTTPTLSTAAGAVDRIVLLSVNNGASWLGNLAGSYAAGPALPLLAEDFATGNFSKWLSLQWKSRNGAGSAYSGTGEYSGQIVADGNRPQVARFEVRDGDIPPFGGDERAEIRGPLVTEVAPGDERWISFDVKLDSTFPAITGWSIITQMHGLPSDGSPGVELSIEADGNIYIDNGVTGVRNLVTTVAAIKGAWHRITMRVLFSSNSAVGYWQVWLDGVQVVAQTARATMISGDTSSYFKIGHYRDAANTATAIVSFDNVRFAATAPADRRNLLRNPTMEVDATDWVGGNAGGTLAICSWSTAFVGAQQPGYVYVDPVTDGNVEIANATTVDVTTGLPYTASAYVSAQVTTNVTPNIDWYNGTTLLSTTSGSATSCPVGSWSRLSVTGTAPASATKARLRMLYALTSSNLARLDGALFEQSSTLGTYFDGSMADACWSGTAHNSPSILAVLTA